MKPRFADDLELVISEQSDWNEFDALAAKIQQHVGGTWVSQLDGLDQRYWDLRVGNAVVTLHLEHDAGISLFPSADVGDPEASAGLLRRIAAFLR